MVFFLTLALFVVVALYVLITPIMSWFNIQHRYPRRRFFSFGDPAFSVNIVVPAKFKEDFLEQNLRALAVQDFPNYTITVVTDTEDDEAVPIVKKIVGRYPHVAHVAAGYSNEYVQKSYVELAGINSQPESEIVVICDTDLTAKPEWLREMVRPFMDPSVEVTSTHSWITPSEKGFAQYLHSCLSGYLTMLMASPLLSWLWGGCFAIRRSTLEKVNITEIWKYAVSDDTILQKTLNSLGIRPLFVPTAIFSACGAPPNLKAFTEWFRRQAHAGRIYLTWFWVMSLLLEMTMVSSVLIALGVIVTGIVQPDYTRPALVSVAILMAMILSGIMVKLPHIKRKDIPLPLWLVIPTLCRFFILVAMWQSAFMNTVRWGKTVYEVGRDGTIYKVTRLT